MIKSNITAYMGTYTFDGEIIVPSRVLTSNPQEEEFDLSYTPNFTIKLNDAYSYLNDTVELSFSYGNNEYTAYANVINRSAGVTTLQYSYGLTTTYVEPTPVVHTLAFNSNEYTCSYDLYTGEATPSNSVIVEYDDNPIIIDETMLDGCTYCRYEQQSGGTGVFLAYDSEAGEYEDIVTCTYEGLTATTYVNVSITYSTPVSDGPTVAYLYLGAAAPASANSPSQYTKVDEDHGGIDTESGLSVLFKDAEGNNISAEVANYIVSITATDSMDSEFNPAYEWVSWENENYPDEGAVDISSSNYEGDVSDDAHNMGWNIWVKVDGTVYTLWSLDGEPHVDTNGFIFVGAGSTW